MFRQARVWRRHGAEAVLRPAMPLRASQSGLHNIEPSATAPGASGDIASYALRSLRPGNPQAANLLNELVVTHTPTTWAITSKAAIISIVETYPKSGAGTRARCAASRFVASAPGAWRLRCLFLQPLRCLCAALRTAPNVSFCPCAVKPKPRRGAGSAEPQGPPLGARHRPRHAHAGRRRRAIPLNQSTTSAASLCAFHGTKRCA